MSANNPLLQSYDLPPFSAIRAEHVKPAIEQILADNRAAIADILATQGSTPTWAGLVVSHLNAVCNSAELREAYESCLPALSAYSTEMGQNRELFQAYEALANGPEAASFDVAQKTILEQALRDFRLSGIDLPPEQQKRYAEVQSKLSELGSQFSNQLLDATQAWTKLVTDELCQAADGCRRQSQRPRRLSDYPGIPELLRGDDLRRRPRPA